MAPQDIPAWYVFENLAANLFRALRVRKVAQNVSLAGHQIDIYFEEETATGQKVRTAVECKFHQKAIGKDAVSRFALIVDFLQKGGYVDRGIMISYQGYTKEASAAAESFPIELLRIEDLEARAIIYEPVPKILQKTIKARRPKFGKNFIFVLMPFSKDYEDLYVYGIRGAAEKTGFVCSRADEIEHNSDIITEILYQIEKASVLVAEMTDKNPNVYYEVGIAHGKNKEVILLARQGSDIPFDLRGINHILYRSIHDLEEKLRRRLKAIADKKEHSNRTSGYH